MKIIIFDEDRKVMDVVENVPNPSPVTMSEVRWDDGGMAEIMGNYVIVEDDVELSDLTEEQILEQIQNQGLMELAREYEEQRIIALAYGFEQKEKQFFDNARQTVLNASNKEEIIVAKQGYRNNENRRNLRGGQPINR